MIYLTKIWETMKIQCFMAIQYFSLQDIPKINKQNLIQ